MSDTGRLAGKVAVVTGGASGIGRAIVRRLVTDGASVAAGDVNEAGLSELRAELGERVTPVRDVRADAYLERIPVGRFASAEEIAALAVILASDDASYLTGANVVVDGAWMTSGYPDMRRFANYLLPDLPPA